MPTVNPRINITVPIEVAALLRKRARRLNEPMSKTALKMILDAMEADDFAGLGDNRLSEAKEWLPHEEVWE
ncbi:MAG: hypothetical protein FWF95_00385 [Syntrophorhabdaceae bacterium]|nr:hypothetical protein [Syntrophorhabdaceae bacterium]